MAKKKTESKKAGGAATIAGTDVSPASRQYLLARVAGNVASGVLVSPSPTTSTPDRIATIAVDVAEEILKKIGI